MQELVLARLGDMCSDMVWVAGLYANFDCNQSSSNVCERIFKFLWKVRYRTPRKVPDLEPLH
jgi:hypothetical protein